MTEREEKALRYDRRQRGIELKKSLATTGERIKFLPNEWQTLANNLPGLHASGLSRRGNVYKSP
jgi:hypothetical protein